MNQVMRQNMKGRDVSPKKHTLAILVTDLKMAN